MPGLGTGLRLSSFLGLIGGSPPVGVATVVVVVEVAVVPEDAAEPARSLFCAATAADCWCCWEIRLRCSATVFPPNIICSLVTWAMSSGAPIATPFSGMGSRGSRSPRPSPPASRVEAREKREDPEKGVLNRLFLFVEEPADEGEVTPPALGDVEGDLESGRGGSGGVEEEIRSGEPRTAVPVVVADGGRGGMREEVALGGDGDVEPARRCKEEAADEEDGVRGRGREPDVSPVSGLTLPEEDDAGMGGSGGEIGGRVPLVDFRGSRESGEVAETDPARPHLTFLSALRLLMELLDRTVPVVEASDPRRLGATSFRSSTVDSGA